MPVFKTGSFNHSDTHPLNYENTFIEFFILEYYNIIIKKTPYTFFALWKCLGPYLESVLALTWKMSWPLLGKCLGPYLESVLSLKRSLIFSIFKVDWQINRSPTKLSKVITILRFVLTILGFLQPCHPEKIIDLFNTVDPQWMLDPLVDIPKVPHIPYWQFFESYTEHPKGAFSQRFSDLS